MSQKSDDSIERFFRKAVVQQDKTFMERDWHSMERMLDAQATTAAMLRTARMRSVMKVTAIAIMVTSLLLIGTENQIEPGNVQMQAAVGTVGPRIEVKTENPTADLHSSVSDCNTREPDTDRAMVTGKQMGLEQGEVSRRQSITPSDKALPGPREVRSVDLTKKESPAITPETKTSLIGQVDEQGHDGVRIASSNGSPQLPEDIEKKALVDSLTLSTKPEGVEDGDPQEESDPSPSSSPRFIVTGLISPDFSTTSLTKYTKPSGVFGILVGYKIFNRVTIMTGVTKSLKKYEGYGSDYSPPEGYWQNRTNGVVPDEVEGKCGIIEVPLLVQYDLIQRSKSRVFLSTGVSSYFMRSENYQYTFNEPNPGAANSWTAREPSQYVFKIGHLSAGYDRMIGKNLSVGIEPFLKVPFEGIGWTDINLYSAGAYLNLRYTIFKTDQ